VVLPLVQQAATALRDAGHVAIGLMSGSGATCFVLHPEEVPLSLADSALPSGARLVRTVTAS
jgi:4-diphosphocytidyl-2C-methyl-D-erythritol kinase